MSTSTRESDARLNPWRLAVVPGVITLAVTLLRVIGERNHWAPSFFNTAPGGPGSVVGIAWLAPIFGIWFALRLARAGDAPARVAPVILIGVVCIAAMIGAGALVFGLLKLRYPGPGVVFSLLCLALAFPTVWAWPSLWKTLLAYALFARIPVVIVSFFAMQGHWGTHYDAVAAKISEPTLVPKFIWFGLIPQLTLWIAFTIVMGLLFGGVGAALFGRQQSVAQRAKS